MFLVLVLIFILLSLLQTGVVVSLTLTQAARLHSAMVKSLLQAKMYFFDSQPVGRILNRFSKDVGVADLILAPLSDLFLQNYARVFSILIMISVLVPYLILPVCGLILVLLLVRCKAVPVTNKIMKIDLQSRSPMATQLGSSISGIATIRAYD